MGFICCNVNGGYQKPLSNLIRGRDLTPTLMVDATGGFSTNDIKVGIDAWIASQLAATPPQPPTYAIINLGTNDIPPISSGAETEAAWLSDMGYILDALHVAWPSMQIRLARIYRSDYSQTYINLYDDTWLPDVIAAGRGGFVSLGPDERVVTINHLTDFTHPDVVGYQLWAQALFTNIGF